MNVNTTHFIGILIAFLIVGIVGIYIGDEMITATNLSQESTINGTGISLIEWTQQNATVPYVGSYGPSMVLTENSGVVAISSNGVANSSDNGATWNTLTEAPGWSTMVSAAAVKMANGHIVIMGGSNNETYMSADDGATWTLQNNTPQWTSRNGGAAVVVEGTGIIYNGGQDVDGIYTNATYRSDDEGATWTTINESCPWGGRAYQGMVVNSLGTIYLWGGQGDGGEKLNDVWQSEDNGVTWSLITASAEWTGRDYFAYVITDEDTIYMFDGDMSHQIWQSTDNAHTWSQIIMVSGWTDGNGATAVITADKNVLLIGGSTKTDAWITTQNVLITYGSSLSASQAEVVNTFVLGILLLKIIVIVILATIIFAALQHAGLIPKIGKE